MDKVDRKDAVISNLTTRAGHDAGFIASLQAVIQEQASLIKEYEVKEAEQKDEQCDTKTNNS